MGNAGGKLTAVVPVWILFPRLVLHLRRIEPRLRRERTRHPIPRPMRNKQRNLLLPPRPIPGLIHHDLPTRQRLRPVQHPPQPLQRDIRIRHRIGQELVPFILVPTHPLRLQLIILLHLRQHHLRRPPSPDDQLRRPRLGRERDERRFDAEASDPVSHRGRPVDGEGQDLAAAHGVAEEEDGDGWRRRLVRLQDGRDEGFDVGHDSGGGADVAPLQRLRRGPAPAPFVERPDFDSVAREGVEEHVVVVT